MKINRDELAKLSFSDLKALGEHMEINPDAVSHRLNVGMGYIDMVKIEIFDEMDKRIVKVFEITKGDDA